MGSDARGIKLCRAAWGKGGVGIWCNRKHGCIPRAIHLGEVYHMKRSTIFLAALLATTACTQSATTPVAGTAIGVDVAGIDKAVKPGDDFDEYANGGWRAKTEIPADRSSTGIF